MREYWAIQVVDNENNRYLCWRSAKNLLFAEYTNKRGFAKPHPPVLFRTKKEATEAIKKADYGNHWKKVAKFYNIIEPKTVRPIKVTLIKQVRY